MSVSRADELRAQAAVAELEEELVRLKDEDSPRLAEVKAELRYARWVARGGPDQEAAHLDEHGEHTNRAVAELYQRWNEG